MSDTPTVDAFKAALLTAVGRYRAMEREAFITAMLKLFDEEPALALEVNLVDGLKLLADNGSIEAAAALVRLSDDEPAWEAIALDAVVSVGMRSKDIKDELVTSELESMLEEFCEEQVAAGKMTIHIDPVTGRKRYGSAKPEASSS